MEERSYQVPTRTEYEWQVAMYEGQCEILAVLVRIAASLESSVLREAVSPEVPVTLESRAAIAEIPEGAELLPTWILTDAHVSRIEDAVEQEQRVRGQAYGG